MDTAATLAAAQTSGLNRRPYTSNVATEAQPLGGLQETELSTELASQWRRLTRAATVVALLTAPALVVWFNQTQGWAWYWSILAALLVVVCFRGVFDLVFHRFIPRPSLFGLESQQLREEDVVARRRVWFWRFWLKVAIVAIVVGVFFYLIGGTGYLVGILPLLLIFPFYMLMNFAILFGPLLIMNLSQIQAFEPGDAEWGVKLADVRGQAEAKEEVRRVVSIWQSGEAFERAGGKRERGLLFLGAPGTGKTMLAKALATGFNSPFISIPGSGFAATFIGIDAIVVRILARRAKRLARKWGGQCIVFIDEIDAVGMRRQALNPGGFGGFAGGSRPPDVHDYLFYGPFGALNPSGDLILENQQWRERLFTERAPQSPGPSAFASRMNDIAQLHVPRRNGRRLARAQPAARRHGRDRQPAVLQEVLHEQDEHAARRDLHRPAPRGKALAAHPRPRSRAASRSTSSARRTCPSTGSTRRSRARDAWAATSGSARRRSRIASTSSTSTSARSRTPRSSTSRTSARRSRASRTGTRPRCSSRSRRWRSRSRITRAARR